MRLSVPIDQHALDGCIVLALAGELDIAAAPQVQRAVLKVLGEVAVVVRQHGLPRVLPIYDTLDQAVAHARSRPPFLRERLRLVPTLEAIETAQWFVGEVCRRWQLDRLVGTAQPLIGEITADAILYEPPGIDTIELRAELRATGLFLAVHSARSRPILTEADDHGDPRPVWSWSGRSPRIGECGGRRTAAGSYGASCDACREDAPDLTHGPLDFIPSG
jgi:hypothetical protein